MYYKCSVQFAEAHRGTEALYNMKRPPMSYKWRIAKTTCFSLQIAVLLGKVRRNKCLVHLLPDRAV